MQAHPRLHLQGVPAWRSGRGAKPAWSATTTGARTFGKWNKAGAQTLDANIPMDLAADDDNMEDINKKREQSEGHAEPTVAEQEQHNAETPDQPQED